MSQVQELFAKGLVLDEIAKITGMTVAEVTAAVYRNYVTESGMTINDKAILAERIANYCDLDLSKATLESLNGVYEILRTGACISEADNRTKQSIINTLQPLTHFSLSGLNNLTKPTLLKLLGEIYVR